MQMGHTLLLMVIQVTTMNILIYPSISNNLGDLPVNVCSLTTGRRRQYHSIRPGQHQADKNILVNFNLHALICHLTSKNSLEVKQYTSNIVRTMCLLGLDQE